MQDPTHLIPICKLVTGETFPISIVNVLPPKNIVDHLFDSNSFLGNDKCNFGVSQFVIYPKLRLS